MPTHHLDLARWLSGRSPLLAFASIVVAMVFVQIPQTRADDLAVGDHPTLAELAHPDRFGWPAVFTCRRRPGDKHPVVVSAKDPDEMNERLLAAGIWPEDCLAVFPFARHGRIWQTQRDQRAGRTDAPDRRAAVILVSG